MNNKFEKDIKIIEKTINLIKKYDYKKFDEYAGKEFPSLFYNILDELIKDENGFKELYKFANFIFMEIQGQSFGENVHFQVNNDMEQFQKFMYLFDFYYVSKLDIDLWKDVSKKAFDVLKNMIENKDFNYPHHNDFIRLRIDMDSLLDKLMKNSIINQKYLDYLNGAL